MLKTQFTKQFLLLLLIAPLYQTHAQNDSIIKKTRSKHLLKKAIIPSLLIGSSLVLTRSDFEINFQKDFRKEISDDFDTSIDDYTRFAPLAQMYIADIVGVESKNHWFDQTKNATISLVLTDLITTKLKREIEKTRPSGSNRNAFPSAHTAYAFSSATVLYEEFKDTKPLLAYSGYLFATTTAYLRIAKNEHWLSDVLLGAGIGIGITKLVYHFDYLFAWNPFKVNDQVVLIPQITSEQKGLYLAIKF
ncbi:phosphatase PAP2 family protein [Psychroserpens sp. SPM9]|uniref:phosphatase PAP2 family protein n=1 Tax=Psychroserpens sp. SPM9 TaxID=2975598 RepID=UPI0021A76D5A|nr:phosphatase PAP2 family protein [Psychroserpens sp. SPM9]MDG5491836.1 phosphatase PAP2 family protein [Psychroserpens sp. SPM9]